MIFVCAKNKTGINSHVRFFQWFYWHFSKVLLCLCINLWKWWIFYFEFWCEFHLVNMGSLYSSLHSSIYGQHTFFQVFIHILGTFIPSLIHLFIKCPKTNNKNPRIYRIIIIGIITELCVVVYCMQWFLADMIIKLSLWTGHSEVQLNNYRTFCCSLLHAVVSGRHDNKTFIMNRSCRGPVKVLLDLLSIEY